MGLNDFYKTDVIPKLTGEFGYKNPNAVPKVVSVTLNAGLGRGLKDAKFQDTVESTLRRITGAQPVKTRARKSIAAFKIREDMVIGLKVTLRGKRMWDFLEKLVRVSLPRVRDFRGISDRKSIAAFKIREDMVIGLKVTLRGKRMWDFLEKLVRVSLPRVRDFRGI